MSTKVPKCSFESGQELQDETGMDGYVCGYIHPLVPQVTSEKSISSCLPFLLLAEDPAR